MGLLWGCKLWSISLHIIYISQRLYSYTIHTYIPKRVKEGEKEMANKKAVQNLVSLINEKYHFVDCIDKSELKIHINYNLNGCEIWLYRVNGGLVSVMLTQYEQIPEKYALLIMLFFDILERQDQKHYSVSRRV